MDMNEDKSDENVKATTGRLIDRLKAKIHSDGAYVEGAITIGGALIITIAMLFVALHNNARYESNGEQQCGRYAYYPVNEVPAHCKAYFDEGRYSSYNHDDSSDYGSSSRHYGENHDDYDYDYE